MTDRRPAERNTQQRQRDMKRRYDVPPVVKWDFRHLLCVQGGKTTTTNDSSDFPYAPCKTGTRPQRHGEKEIEESKKNKRKKKSTERCPPSPPPPFMYEK
jgi:hypothetical protein